jgi:dihydroorotase
MKVLIRKATIVDNRSPQNGTINDILVENGIVARIAPQIKSDSTIQSIDIPGIHVSPGWMDVACSIGDPGYEYRETLESGCAAAAAGGFTDILLLPNTSPPTHNKAQVEYLKRHSAGSGVRVHPMGSITKNTEGKELAEIYDMHHAGATAFSDGLHPIQQSGILLKALQYVKTFEGTIIQLPNDKSIGGNGMMHEGVMSTRIGIPGKPALAEELMAERDIALAAYTQSRIHLTGVSASGTMRRIREAKGKGQPVSCSVSPLHLFFSDQDLATYDTGLKIMPPLRTTEDQQLLLAALLDGTVDCFTSLHQPLSADEKVCEFAQALYGASTLESCFGAIWSLTEKHLPIGRLIEMLTYAPRSLFGLPSISITEGETASLTLFDPSVSFLFTREMIRSRSCNNPFIGRQLRGKVLGIINENRILLNTPL